ncbi:AAA family ATPase [Agrobacterium rubi]|nr:AAA family ATPase [Agrobacterium rubi]NTF24001.1 AAA family ATPase [Agrobacterium rubi]
MKKPTFQTLAENVPVTQEDIPSWEQLCEWLPVLLPLAECEQDEIHHAEGDVATHTRMVISELVGDPEWQQLDDHARFRLFWASVLHDVGKPDTSKKVDGRWTSPNHSRVGSSIARRVLRDIGIPFETREQICSIIAAHQTPFHLYGKEDRERRAIALSLSLIPRELIMHARADARGRICADPDDLQMRLDLAEMEFANLGCLDRPFPFGNDESRVAYFMSEGRNPFYEAHEAYECDITVMSGLPGSGKDTWIAANRPGVPVVSLDTIREELDVTAGDNQGGVEQAAKERVKEHLRTRSDFVFNTTNITLNMRGKILNLIRDYNRVCKARVTIVYIEPNPKTLLSQNGGRSQSVPPAVIERLVRKLDPPRPWEAHEIVSITPGLPTWDGSQYPARNAGTSPR